MFQPIFQFFLFLRFAKKQPFVFGAFCKNWAKKSVI